MQLKIFGGKNEAVNYLISGCKALAQNENRDKALLGWSIGHFEVDIILRGDKWYEHQPEALIQNEILQFGGTRQFSVM